MMTTARRCAAQEPRAFATDLADAAAGPDRPAITQGGSLESYEAGESIYAQEDRVDYVYRVAAGIVRTFTLRRDGRRVVHAFHLTGDLFGLEGAALRASSAEAVSDTRLAVFDHARLQALAGVDPKTANALWTWLLWNQGRTAERLTALTGASAWDRVAYFLFDMARRGTTSDRIELPMSRYDIADYLGLSSETVSRAFTALRDRGLIATDGRSVRLLEPAFLARRYGRLDAPHFA